jgi:hypothetical protein
MLVSIMNGPSRAKKTSMQAFTTKIYQQQKFVNIDCHSYNLVVKLQNQKVN